MRKNAITTALADFELPAYSEIPDVGLYLDQVSKYINNYLVNFPDMEVTPSMISNYAKQKLIHRVNKKTYTRDQIATLLIIVLSKTVLSIDNIKTMIEILNPNDESIEKHYTFFSTKLHSALSSFQDNKKIQVPSSELNKQNIMLYNTVIAIAHKMYLEKYFEVVGK